MIGLDTNVLVRYIIRDDQAQTDLADALIGGLTPAKPGYVTTTVLVELWWVLGRSYGRAAGERVALFEALSQSDEVRLAAPECVRQALDQAALGADLADALIAAAGAKAGCRATATFDQAAAKLAGMTPVCDLITSAPPGANA